MVVCPGFIDIQSHSIAPLMTDGRSLSKVAQGVTTEIMGELWTPAPFGGRRAAPFGWSPVPAEVEEQARGWSRFGHWLEFLEGRGVSVNVGSFIGGGTVREYAKGWDGGEPSPEEMAVMRQVTAEAMEDGALGIATALIYPPNCYSPDWELVALATEVARRGGIYVTHIRSESDRLLECLKEAIDLSRQSAAPLEIYHLKASGQPNWHKMPRAIEIIEEARAGGVDVTADMYPYVASGTGLTVLLPEWVAEGGRLWANLEDPATRARIHAEMLEAHEGALISGRSSERDYVMPLGFKQPENRPYTGMNLAAIAAQRGQDWAEATIDLLLSERQRIATVFFTISEENLRRQLRQPWIKISSDAPGLDPEGQENPVHPRAYGTFARVLGYYVREEKVLSLEEAVRIMTSAVASRLGLPRRGLLREGCFADVVVFDPLTIADRATFTEPHQLAVGARDVWVNGGPVFRNGQHAGAMPGRALYGAGRRA
jgi:dihydroorotase/N-acyl-D-amino-acid deacylase